MIRYKSRRQINLEGFYLPFGGKLNPENRWGKWSEAIPWDELAVGYYKSSLLVDPGIVWYSSYELFFFDIIEVFAEYNIPESERLLTLKRSYFNELMCFFSLPRQLRNLSYD